MEKLLLLGDEAIAQGGIDAGMSGMYAYPGTPSTEIMEYIQHSKEAKDQNIVRVWSANEKTSMEAALGMSYAGKRAMVAMKHVGLNVAADAFVNSSITGVNGGLIVIVADDPSMHSSQNEQDSRFYGNFALMPILEPSNQQEAYDAVGEAFRISEKYKVPILLRITTRLAHSRYGVARSQKQEQNVLKLPKNTTQFVLLPSIAKKQYKILLSNQEKFAEESEKSTFNQYFEGSDKSLGIIACGLAYNYLMENFEGQNNPLLKIAQYPLPYNKVEKIYSECDEILVLEEGMPLVEEKLRGFLNKGKTIHGRLDGSLPRDGELNPNYVAKAMGIELEEGKSIPSIVKGRPPGFCTGCGHIDAYKALNEAMEEYGTGRVMADIGCYTLAALPPFNSINSCVDMGASVTMAVGAADAGLFPVVGVIGDSTFTHSGMTGLLDAVIKKSPVTIMILDNSTTGMTGGQDSSALDKIEDICVGIGVEEEHIRVFTPLKKHHKENVAILKEELEYRGVSVVIPRRECIQTLSRRMRQKLKKK